MDPYDVVRVSLLPRIGPHRGRTLLNAFRTFDNIAHAGRAEIIRLEGFNDGLSALIPRTLRDAATRAEIERVTERSRLLAERSGARLVTFRDPSFPAVLQRIWDAPLFLFMRGTYTASDERAIAVVGTRAPTEYGRHAAQHLTAQLAESGVCIVSGLASGIDTVAHRTALAAGTRTIAVLGSGVCRVYPSSNLELAERIAERGCVMSELPLDAKPDAVNFPRRNRIVSGLSMGVLVVESGVKGGAILTAEFALDQNREVFAVPGSIFNAKSEGTNRIIMKGAAHGVLNANDIHEELPLLYGGAPRASVPDVQLTTDEERVMRELSADPRHIDALAASTAMPTHDLLVHLLGLEFKGVVRQLPGKNFVLAGA